MESPLVDIKKGSLVAEMWVWSRVYPLARPRLSSASGRPRVFQPKANQRALLAELGAYPALCLKRPVVVEIAVLLGREKPGHETTAKPCYGDVDNLAKAVLDALVANEILYDDIYVVGLRVTKQLASEDACRIQIYDTETQERECKP